MNRKIAIFIPSLGGGGAERVMVTLANAFAKRGYEVDLVVGIAQGPQLMNISKNVHLIDLKVKRVLKTFSPLMNYLRREQPDIMLSALTHTNIIAILAKKISCSKVFLMISERSTINEAYARTRGFIAKLVYQLTPWLYPKADAISVVSQKAKESLIKFAKLHKRKIKVDVIYNPFDLDWINKQMQEKIEHPWVRVKHVPIILAVGRLTEAKDYPTLIKAFTLLRKVKKVKLLILGEGELRSPLQKLINELELPSDEIQLLGYVENPYAYLARCDLFVLSSQWEGLPGALIEALACNVPIVSTNCHSGPSEILENGKWGRLVPIKDEASLANAMSEVLDIPKTKLPDGKIRAADFTLERSVDAYLQRFGI